MKLRRWPSIRPTRAAMAWVGAITIASLLEVWLHLQTTEVGYQLGTLRRLVDRLASENGQLEMELTTLRSPGSLDAVAKTRFGLRAPTQGQIVGVP